MLGIYIHIPFCVKKCGYCDFASVEDKSLIPPYIAALEKEIDITGRMYGEPVDTVFIGGGTPGILGPGVMPAIMERLRSAFEITNDAEVTIEVNPCVVTPVKLAEYRECGINRISIGLQAAQDRLLRLLGRQHDAHMFGTAFKAAREAGFDNINIDVIYALPTQTMDDWEETLYHVLYLRPEHISAYALKLEEGTPMYGAVADGGLELPDEDTDADMYIKARSLLCEKGYTNYEISNFAFAGRECRHNLKYWTLQNYLGLGAAAHSGIERLRFSNTEDIPEYIKQMEQGSVHYASSEFISDSGRIFEFIMLRLRLWEGFTFAEYKELFGKDFRKTNAAQIAEAEKHGLITVDAEGMAPTEKGFLLQNTLIHILTGNK